MNCGNLEAYVVADYDWFSCWFDGMMLVGLLSRMGVKMCWNGELCHG